VKYQPMALPRPTVNYKHCAMAMHDKDAVPIAKAAKGAGLCWPLKRVSVHDSVICKTKCLCCTRGYAAHRLWLRLGACKWILLNKSS